MEDTGLLPACGDYPMKFSEIKDTIERKAKVYEVHLTWLLIIVAVVLLAVAFFGKPKHKAIAAIYIVL